MPRNVYFSQAVRSEQNLYEDLIVESLKIYGQDVYYIPRTLVNRDTILNEDPGSKFDDAYLMEAYIENVDGFEGAGDLYSKFGLEIRDEATFVISRKTWNHAVGLHEGKEKPSEGDLLFLPMTNSFFEISEWQNFLQNQLGKKPKHDGDILPANIDDIFYKEGDFRIHFTALNFEQRQAVMEEYAFRKDNPDRGKWKTVNYKRYIKGRTHR